MTARIFLLPGMNGNVRIFDEIVARIPAAVVVPWIPPLARETIANYAQRLAAGLAKDAAPDGDSIICGVSFGGMVARELAVHCRAKTCVLVSSARCPSQLPAWVRGMRWIMPFACEPLLHAVGKSAASFPRKMRSAGTAKLTKFCGPRGSWNRWAAAAVLQWRPSHEIDCLPTVQIHGDCDTTIPIRREQPDVVIRGGGHLIALTHADEIARILVKLAA